MEVVVVVVVVVLEAAGAPHMLALDFSLAMLARFGPLFVLVVFWIPALALAADQSDPNTSSPDFDAAGLLPADDEVVEENEEVDCRPGRVFADERGC